jgi:hypothetical protein
MEQDFTAEFCRLGFPQIMMRLSSGQKMTSKEQCPVSRFSPYLRFYRP